MIKMKKYIAGFIHNGLLACGFGPIIWAVVYFFLEKNGIVEILTVRKVVSEIITVALLAFIAGGINIIHKIEQIPLMVGITVHGIVLYLDYVIIYLLNGWLDSALSPFLVFTACFFVGYAIVWAVIYFVTKRNANRLNQKLSQLQKQDGCFEDRK